VLFRLGQLAYERNQWVEAAVNLVRTYQTKRDLDPGVRYMAGYFLGQSLLRSGYDAAAVQPLTEFLREPERFSRSTRYPRQARILGSQRRVVFVQLGDALMRLGRVERAIEEYKAADEQTDVSPRLTAPRLVYALVCEGRFEQAEQHVVELFSDPEQVGLAAALADYLTTVHPSSTGIQEALTKVYREADRPEAVAQAMARMLDGEARTAFLVEHLNHQPTHADIYKQLVDGLAARDPDRLVALTTGLIGQAPQRASQMVEVLIAGGPKIDVLIQAFEKLPVADRVSEVGWFLRGMLELEAGSPDAAEKAFTRSLDRNPDFAPAQVASMELLIAQGRPGEVLELAQAYGDDAPAQIRFLIARANQAVGRHAEAIGGLDRLIGQFPSNAEYLIAAATSDVVTRNFDQAEQRLLKAISIDPQRELAYEWLFDLYEVHQPDVTKYRRLLATARKTIPNSRVTRLKTARLYAAVGETARAEALLRAVVADHPNDPEALQELSSLLGRAERWDELFALLDKLLDANPANLAALDTLRAVARLKNQPELFFNRYETYLNGLPVNARNIERLADLYAEWGKTDQAIAKYDQLLDLAKEPNEIAECHIKAAMLLLDAKKADEAVARMDQAIAVGSDDRQPAYKTIKASLLAEAEKFDEAVAVMNQAIKDHPEQSDDLRLSLARMLAGGGKIDQAIAEVDKVIASQPGQAADLYYLQSTLVHGDAKNAALYEKILTRALEVDPDHAPANNDLGYTWADQGKNLAKAEQMIRKALRIEGNSAAYLDSLGWVLYKQGKFNEAAAWLNRARQTEGGDDPIILDHLGDALWKAGNTDQAIKIWAAALNQLTKMGEEIDDVYKPLLPSIRGKLDAAEKGNAVPVATVPKAPTEEQAPDLPLPEMQ
jgi:tetratricopeptide (TPR) repeat protein